MMTSLLKLEGRVAVVTGGARGIGRGIAARLAAEGALVTIADIDVETARRSAAELGPNVLAEHVDISAQPSVDALAAAIRHRHGRCEILVNNAAMLDASSISSMTFERYLEVINVNQHGALRMTLAMLPLLKCAGEGRRILNISSIMGLRGSRDSVPYSTAKGAITNLTRALACDLAEEGILVNALAPGFIDTDMAILPDGGGHEHETEWFRQIYLTHGRIPLRRAGLPEDVAGPALFLCSDDCRYVTGQVLLVDGGVSATF